MFARLIVQLPVWLTVAGSAAATRPRGHGTCRYIPGDAGWPSLADWQQLNHTVEGRLIATDPLGDVCHDKGPFEAYNATACAALASAITTAGAQTFEHVPGEILDPYFQNLSCSAFTPADWSCELGERAVYSIDVRTAGDVQAGLAFAREKNIRLVIKSTGIDYMGKSTGQGSLALWLWNLNTTEIIPTYTSQSYSGAAIKLGPGAISGDAILVAAAAGYRFVGPECGLVGIAGGYTQGGGHSQLATEYGLAADQTLEWEVVTAEGEYLVATPEQNSDLYWALSGGGGGTYGVVLSMIVKAYPDGPFAGGSLIFTNTNETAYWKALDIWFSLTPSFVDGTPNNVQFIFNQDEFLGFSLTLPNQTTSAIDALLGPFLAELQSLDITYNISSYESATYIEHYIQSYGPLPYGSLCPDYVNIASRLIPRSTVLNPVSNSNLMAVYKSILADANFTIGCSILNVAEIPSHPANAVLPAWREAIAYCNPQSAWDWENPLGSVADKEKLVSHYFPAIEEATPGSGVNLNEMDPLYQGSWKDTMYGINYDRLLEIKHANDPYNLLYAKFAVGSDEFTFDQMGRLCNLT